MTIFTIYHPYSTFSIGTSSVYVPPSIKTSVPNHKFLEFRPIPDYANLPEGHKWAEKTTVWKGRYVCVDCSLLYDWKNRPGIIPQKLDQTHKWISMGGSEFNRNIKQCQDCGAQKTQVCTGEHFSYDTLGCKEIVIKKIIE